MDRESELRVKTGGAHSVLCISFVLSATTSKNVIGDKPK